MNRCRICGRSFDPLGFQVLVPGLSEGFDRVECAEQARAALPAAAAGAPPAAVVRPFPGAPAVAAAVAAPAAIAAVPRPLLVGANLGVLAAGAAVTAFLWLRVFGADSLTPVVPDTSAAQAFERRSVPAVIDTGSGGTVGERPRLGARPGGREPGAGEGFAPGGATLVAELPSSGVNGAGGGAVGPGEPRPGGDGGEEPEPPTNPPLPPAQEPDDEDDGDDDHEDDDESAKRPGEDEDEEDTEDEDD